MASSADNATSNSIWTVIFPHQNDTNALRSNITSGWVDSPNVRGTFDILQSCVLTLVACIYTALHLDLPENSAWYHVLWSKAQWVMLTLFAPEIVLYIAADQLQQAWKLRRKLRHLQTLSDTVDKNFNFDLKYAFFVIMRGINVDIEDILSFPDLNPKAYHHFANMEYPRSACVSPHAVIRLAQRGHWLYISNKQIDDKSKADYIQKALVLTQILWMVTQCITRYICDLPLTLLEVHTIIHVVCAVFLYACWFQKPLNVQEPEVVSSSQFLGEVSQMVQQQFYSSWSNELALFPPWSPERPIPPLRLARDRSSMLWYSPDQSPFMRQGDITLFGLALHTSSRELEVTPEFLRRWEAILTTFPFENREVLARGAAPKFEAPHLDEEVGLIEQGKTISQALYLCRLDEFEEPVESHKLPFNHGKWKFNANVYAGILGLTLLLPACYGGVHLAAWNWTFPSHFEGVFWKVCCLYIVFTSPVFLFVNTFVFGLLVISPNESDGDDDDDDQVGTEDESKKQSARSDWSLEWRAIVMICLNVPVLIMYVVARGYIVLEAFLSLRSVPLGVYLSPAWLQMFPHL
ncbi:hypothetical protein QQX98_000438 [Neonectria punicea]|uniref:Uncharacterized protein n=1 Tax=Neonectria punicea TaxID=979145 RepID=A0ABR1HUU4_9HYPO